MEPESARMPTEIEQNGGQNDGSGWVKLHRDIIYWEWWDDPKTFKLFVYFLLMASHKAREWRSIPLKRGQLVTSRRRISRDTKLSEQNIRTIINRLELTNEITIEPTHQYTLITIVNYDTYQSPQNQTNQQLTHQNPKINPQTNQQKPAITPCDHDTYQTPPEQTNPQTNQQKPKNQPHTRRVLLQEDKIREDASKKSPGKKTSVDNSCFEQFWDAWPKGKKVGKGDAKKAFAKIKPSADLLEKMIIAIKAQEKSKQWTKDDRQYIPNPATWLNAERWEDELEPTGNNGGVDGNGIHWKPAEDSQAFEEECRQAGALK